MFAILKTYRKEIAIIGEGVVEILQDGFGFLRSPESNYLPALMIFMYPLIKCDGLA